LLRKGGKTVPSLKDQKIDSVELVPSGGGLVQEEETIRESSEDESSSRETRVRRFPVLWCGHYRPYAFSCFCGKRFCKQCLETGRVWYCEECGETIGSCCYRKRHDGTFCPECSPGIDWKGPVGEVLVGTAFAAGLFLSLYLLYRLVR
jgi:hypothetical protein